MFNKRNLLILLIGIVTSTLVSIFALFQTSAQNPSMESLYGSWNAVVIVEAQGFTFPALVTFGADGTVIADEPPLPGETSGHGNWISTSDGGVAFTFIALYSGEEGAYAGNLKVVGNLQYDADADTWQGPFKIDVVDGDGQALYSDVGTFDLTRITVEMLN